MNEPTPCVHLQDGRILLGSKTALLDQLDRHHGQFADTKRMTMMIGSIVLGVGAVILIMVMMLYVLLSRKEREQKLKKNSTYDDDDMIGWSSKRSARFRHNAARAAKMGRPQFDDVMIDCEDEVEFSKRPSARHSERDTLLYDD
jgi:hypothetical protein